MWRGLARLSRQQVLAVAGLLIVVVIGVVASVGDIASSAGSAIDVGNGPSPARVGYGSGNFGDGAHPAEVTVSRIDTDIGEVTTTPVGGHSIYGIAVGDGSVWVSNGEFGVKRINATTGSPVGNCISAPNSWVASVAVGEGIVWATTSFPDGVIRIAASTGKVIGDRITGRTRPRRDRGRARGCVGCKPRRRHRYPDRRQHWEDNRRPNQGRTPTFWGRRRRGAVWVTNHDEDTVTRIDASTGQVIGKPIRVGRSPLGIAVGEGGVWVANNLDGTVTRIDASTGQVIGNPIRVGKQPWGIALGPTIVWVTNTGDDTVTRIDASNGKVIASS